MLPEIDFVKLVRLGAIAKAKNKTSSYESLKASLRKIQWVKFVGLRAIMIEQDVKNHLEPHAVLMDPLGQIDHSLCMTDLLIHTKSSFDSMAIFLTDLLELDFRGAKRDLKKKEFREAVKKIDQTIGNIIDRLEPWLDYIQKIRDEWIHRDSTRSFVVIGPSDVGVLPIPKKPSMVGKLPPNDMRITSKNFWSTQSFVEYHFSQLVTLVITIIQRSIVIETRTFDGEIPRLEKNEINMARKGIFFPTRLTTRMTIKKMAISNLDLSAYFKRLCAIFPRKTQ